MKRKTAMMLVLSLVCLSFAACGNKDRVDIDEDAIEETTIGINRDGTVEFASVETFDKSYYNESELKSFAETSVSDYNTKVGAKEAVSIDKVTVKDGKAYVALLFDTMEHFKDYNNDGECKLYSWDEVKTKKFVPEEFKGVIDSNSVSTQAISVSDTEKVLVVQGDYRVKVLGKILYYSSGAIVGNDEIKVTSDHKTIIIYEE